MENISSRVSEILLSRRASGKVVNRLPNRKQRTALMFLPVTFLPKKSTRDFCEVRGKWSTGGEVVSFENTDPAVRSFGFFYMINLFFMSAVSPSTLYTVFFCVAEYRKLLASGGDRGKAL